MFGIFTAFTCISFIFILARFAGQYINITFLLHAKNTELLMEMNKKIDQLLQ